MAATKNGRDLATYREKRKPGSTPEPFNATKPAGSRFVVQLHAARARHYDFRLEHAGVLLSWAVPKGPSLDPADKRLAVRTEDHPLDYVDFEGVIPEGQYGAGAVIVWDRGRYSAANDFEAGLESGKLLFDLYGHKLTGRWTLVKTARGPKDWLLIKERDGHVRTGDAARRPEDSVLSGRSVEDVAAGRDVADDLARECDAAGARLARVAVVDVRPMLATPGRPFSDPGWVFELKHDGYRLLAGKEAGKARLLSRNGRDYTSLFPDVAEVVAALPYDDFLLDGEVVVAGDDGRPSFAALQQRATLVRRAEIARAAAGQPATFFAFDLPLAVGRDLRALPLLVRKRLLGRLLPTVGPIRLSEHIAADGERMFREVEKLGLEGIVAKRADSAYVGRRSTDWIKIATRTSDDFAVVGHAPPKSGRRPFGALLLAQRGRDGWVYAGRVGSGFTSRDLERLAERLATARRGTAPAGAEEEPGDARWIEPEIVVEVRYKSRSAGGRLRHPVFVAVRPDKTPHDCPLRGDEPEPDDRVRESARAKIDERTERPRRASVAAAGVERLAAKPDGRGGPSHARAARAPSPREPTTGRSRRPPADAKRAVRITNRDKVFWPRQGHTKGDLVDYYTAVAPWLLPYLADRPVVLTRYPDGIDGKSFFQKDAPEFVPDWIRLEALWSEGSEREIRYFVLEDTAGLAYVANLASIPLHVWSSRIGTLERPDWCILDLDPKGAPFEHVVRVATAIRDLCDAVGLPSFPKTSGSTGLHVLIPLGARYTHDQSRTMAEVLARWVARELPEIATVRRALDERDGRVYIDYLQNGHGRLLVAPYSARPVDGACVSMPLRWSEVTPRLDMHRYTIETVPAMLARQKTDPLAAVLTRAADLPRALERLGKLVGRRR